MDDEEDEERKRSDKERELRVDDQLDEEDDDDEALPLPPYACETGLLELRTLLLSRLAGVANAGGWGGMAGLLDATCCSRTTRRA